MNRDDIYEALMAMHRGLDERQSLLLNSRLVLLLAEHIKDEGVILRAIAEAGAIREDAAR